jgi:choline dehydrogenase
MEGETLVDHVVVGAGTAGCLLANRLAADGARDVLLLEAGGSDRYHWVHVPVGYLHCIDNPRTDWRFRTEPDAGLNGRTLIYPRGKVLGGSSSINGMIYMRGQARDYDGWAAALGDDAWRWDACLPDFMAHEDHQRLDGEAATPERAAFARLHGHGGELRVEKQRLHWPLLDAFADAAVQAGIPRTADFNGGDNEGVGYFEVTQRGGWRWSSARAFLRPALRRGRGNLALWTGAHTTKLLLGRDPANGALRCEGVEVLRDGRRTAVRARRGVVLAAGAIGSPHLLQLSGIGPPELLAAHGIPVVHALAGVGANLQDHLQIRAVYKLEGARTLNTRAGTWWGKAGIGLEYLLKRTGPMSMAPSQLGLFTKSDPAKAHADLEFHVQPLSLDAFGQPLHRFDAFTASVCNLNPTSRGTVQLRSPDPLAAPAIAPRYLATDADRLVAARSLRVARRIVAQPAMQRFRPEEWKPGAHIESDEDLARLAGDIATTIFHPVGTARMGADGDPGAVLDSRLAVRGVAGLHVADASAMPTITSGNTNAPTLLIAEKAARWIRAAPPVG